MHIYIYIFGTPPKKYLFTIVLGIYVVFLHILGDLFYVFPKSIFDAWVLV